MADTTWRWLTAPSATRDLWLEVRTPDGIDLTWRSPDGTPLDEVIGNGEPDSLPLSLIHI